MRLVQAVAGVLMLTISAHTAIGQPANVSSSTYAQQGRITSGLLRDGNRLLLSGANIIRFETHLAGDVLLRSRLDDIAQRAFDPTCDALLSFAHNPDALSCFRRHWGMHTYATIQLYLRMLRSSPTTPSSPIKTPSFIPKWTLQYIGLKRPASLPGSTASMYIINIVPVGHHSNGQDGCEYTIYTRPGPGLDCEPDADVAPEELQINTYDGNFSVDTFHSGGLYHRWIKFIDGPGYTAPVARETTIGGTIEYNRIDGLLPEILAARYGKLRWSAAIHHTLNNSGAFSRVDFRYRFQYAVGIDRPTVHVAEAALFFKRTPQLGYYIRYYNGRDYLNIAFENHVRRFEVGFAFDWESIWTPEALEPSMR